MLMHEGTASDAASGDTSSFIVDPTLEETQNLSNNLVLVTVIDLPSESDADAEMEGADYVELGVAPVVVIEKVTEALRTSYAP